MPEEIAGIKRKKTVELIIVFTVLIFCEVFFFRNIIGNDNLIGDNADGRLTALLAEHWWNFFRGREAFKELAMFFPNDEVIGYTDLLLGYGIIHALYRLLGIDLYNAYKLTLISVHIIGTSTMYYLLRRKLHCRPEWALFGTIGFCFSNALSIHIGHTQLCAICFLPVLLILFIGFAQNFRDIRKRNLYAYSCIFWFVLLTYNSWYIACFTGVFVLLFIIILLAMMKKDGASLINIFKTGTRLIWKDLIGYFVFTVILYIPFLNIYLPAMSKTLYGYKGIVIYMPEFSDLINVTEDNFMMGWLVKLLNLEARNQSKEVTQGFSIILLAVFFWMFAVILKKQLVFQNKRWSRNQGEAYSLTEEILIKSIFVTVIISILSIIRIDSNGTSLWHLVYAIVPVVRSMRAVARFWLWLSFPISVITAYCANKYFKMVKAQKFCKCAPTVIILVLLFISNIHLSGVYSDWNASDEYDFLNKVRQPPQNIESFYIVNLKKAFYIVNLKKEREGKGYYQAIGHLDAFDIATHYSTKTINGYSGQIPEGWGNIWDISSEAYERGIFEWVVDNGLKNVYAYDERNNSWVRFEERCKNLMTDTFYPLQGKLSLSSGYTGYNPEEDFVWSGRDFKVAIRNPEVKKSGLLIQLGMEKDAYIAQNPDVDPEIQIIVNGNTLKYLKAENGIRTIAIPVEAEDDMYEVEIRTNCYFNPKELGWSEDDRDIALRIYYVGN